MSIFQDKKLILHISLEIIIIGSMTYFFHTKSKSLELRVKSIEEQFSKEISILQDSISQLKKQLKKSEMAIEEIKSIKPLHQASTSQTQFQQKLQKNETKREKNKDEFGNVLFTTFSMPQASVYKQQATVELIDDIVENKDNNEENDNKEIHNEKNNKDEDQENENDNEDEENKDNLSENGNELDKELENELKELEN